MTNEQISIAEKLFKNAKEIDYGFVSVELKIHAGKISIVTHIVSKNTRQNYISPKE